MAKGDIVLDIGSKFNDEGFKKLKSGMNDAGRSAKNASKAMSGISQALGNVQGQAGKTLGAVSNLVQGFMTMGVVGGVIALGTAAIEGLFKWLNKTNDALSELTKGFKDKLTAAVKSTTSEIAKINKEFQSLLSKHGTKTEREDIVQDATLAGMEEQKKQALAGKEGSEAAKLELEWTKKIEAYKEEQSKKRLKDVQEEIRLTQDNLKKLEQGRNDAKNKFKAANTLAVEGWNDDKLDLVTKNRWSDEAQIAKKQMLAFDKPIEELKAKLEQLTTKELKVSTANQLQPEKSKSAVMEAEQKVADALKKEADVADEKAKKLKEESEKNASLFVKSYEEAKAKAQEKARREELQDKIENSQEDFAQKQKDLNTKLTDAKKAVTDWIQNLNSNKNQSFSDFNRAQNEKDKLVTLGQDENGNDITITKKQENQVKSNRQILERLKNNKHLNAAQQRELERRQAFDDRFNPERLKEKRDEAARAKKALEEAEKQQKDDIHKLRKMLVDDNGVAA